MRRSAAALLASLAALLASPALAETPPPPAISVNGEATMSTAPDQAQINAGVTTEAKTAREASDANNAAMAKVLQALKGAGIEEKDYQTSRLSLQPQYPPNRTGPAAIAGYRANNQVTIKLRNIGKVANVIDTLVGAGANEIGGISFVVSQASRLLDEIREKALADARRKAEIFARAAGVALGEPLAISEETSSTPLYRSRMNAPMAAAAAAQVAPGEETLSVTVHASWAIKQRQP